MFKDKILTCKECGAEFVFTAGQQEFFAEKGFTNEPSRCPTCRAARKQRGSGRIGSSGQRTMYSTTCSLCGAPTQVPFQPKEGRPVYCRDCYQLQRADYR